MGPPQIVRVVLAECRTREMDFEAAWQLAVRSLPRLQPDIIEWRHLLAQQKPVWQGCYERTLESAVLAPTIEDDALVVLAMAVAQTSAQHVSLAA